jgi:glutamine amidotransferase
MIGIINYGMGNLGSVKRKFDRIRVDSFISGNPSDLKKADRLVLPGVGHFSNAVSVLKSNGLWELLNEEVIYHKKPILGICLGMQLMASHSEEGDVEGLGWFDANIIRFRIGDKLNYKVPHMGWNEVSIQKKNSLFDGVDFPTGFYFVHSYHIVCQNKTDILCTTDYEYQFPSGIQKENITGLQFHPEKSHEAGERLLYNFNKFPLT